MEAHEWIMLVVGEAIVLVLGFRFGYLAVQWMWP